MRIIILLSITLFLLSCENQIYKPSDKQKIANEIRNRVAKQLYKEKGLYPCGSGAQMMNEIKMLALSFDYYKQINIEESREMLILAANKFINEINSENKIRKYLSNYPFRPENVEIRIFLQNPDRSEFSPEKLRVISMIEGRLRYDIGDPETGLLKTIHRETYDEALKKIGNNLHRLTTLELPKHNHLFQVCKTGSLDEYGEIEETMSPQTLNTISDWILSKTQRSMP